MEKKDVLKAGHCVEPFRGMQFCAVAAGTNSARAARRVLEASGAISFALAVALRDLKINEGFQNAQWCSERSLELSSINTPGSWLLGVRSNRCANLRAACYRKLKVALISNPCCGTLIGITLNAKATLRTLFPSHSNRVIRGSCTFVEFMSKGSCPDRFYLIGTMDEETADKTAAINLGQVEEPSKNALKKANKQRKLAEEKATKSATNTTKEVARSETKRAVTKAPKKKIEGAALIG